MTVHVPLLDVTSGIMQSSLVAREVCMIILNKIFWLKIILLAVLVHYPTIVFGKKAVVFTFTSSHDGDGFDRDSSSQGFIGFDDSYRWRRGHVNGDGIDDLIQVYGNKGGKTRVMVHLSSGSAFEYKSSYTGFAIGFLASRRWLTGDFNGDGLDDLVHIYGNDGKARAMHGPPFYRCRVRSQIQLYGVQYGLYGITPLAHG